MMSTVCPEIPLVSVQIKLGVVVVGWGCPVAPWGEGGGVLLTDLHTEYSFWFGFVRCKIKFSVS